MEINNEELACPLVTTTRRDSGLFVSFDVKNVCRDSGLEINDLDRVVQSRSKNKDCEIDDLGSREDELVHESVSPIHEHNKFSKLYEGYSLNDTDECKNDENLSNSCDISKKNMSNYRTVSLEDCESSDAIMTDGTSAESSTNLTQTAVNSGMTSELQCEMFSSADNTSETRTDTPLKPESGSKVLLRRKQNVRDRKDNTGSITGKPPRPDSCRPKSVSKVPISSRVELMMNSDLFKKYLSKHENLIDKISVRQGRGTGLKKALSNLDLSQLDLDVDGNEDKTNLNSSSSFNDNSLKTAWENSPSVRTRRNTYCEADFDNSCDNKENADVTDTEKRNDTLHQSHDSNPMKSRGNSRAKFAIPSFHQFKMSKHFKQIPEEEPLNEDEDESCENCDKNRTVDNEKKKSRSHTRCQRIREKYSQNHEDLSVKMSTSQNSTEANICDNNDNDTSCLLLDASHKLTLENQHDNDVDKNNSCIDIKPKIPLKEKTVHRSEIPVRIKSSSPIASQSEEKADLNCNAHSSNQVQLESTNLILENKTYKVHSSPVLMTSEDVKNSLPPKHSSDKRIILRASRKRKIGKKNPFVRSQSDSQLKVDSASNKETPEKLKSKPPPLEFKTVRSCENFSSISANSSPMYCASSLNDSNETSSPMSASNLRSFDFSNDKIVKFEIEQDVSAKGDNSIVNVEREVKLFNENMLTKGDNLIDLTEVDIHSAHTQETDSKGDNSCTILNVELWSDNSDKQIESTPSTTSESSNDHVNESVVRGSGSENNYSSQTKCILDQTDSFLSEHSLYTEGELLSLDAKSSVTRSTSDVCNSTTSDALKKRRERKERPYKSDPFTGSVYLPAAKPRNHTSNKDDVYEVDEISLEEVEEEEEEELNTSSFSSSVISEQDWDRELKKQHRLSDVSADSGVIGPEYLPSPTSTVYSTSSSISGTECRDSCIEGSGRSLLCSESSDDGAINSLRSPRSKVSNGCKDCGNLDNNNRTKRCSKCERKSSERKEIILEIKETEESYGRDLIILKEHFYKPMKSAGLLSLDHLEGIFLNLEELIHVNTQFVKKLQAAVDMTNKKGDENFRTVSIGNLFLDSSSLILAFENYCVNQGQATVLLEQLEREKELLRIFLRVSQNQNPILRRMPLNSFLMVPVQRIMRYPLLLERLYKFTSGDNADKSAIMEAKLKIEDILDHINSKTKHGGGTIKLKRKMAENTYQRISITEKIEVNKVATEVLGWNRKEVCDIVMCRLQVAPLSDQTWAAKRLKTLKFSTVHCVLLTLGQSDADITDLDDDSLLFAKKSKVIQAAVVLIKEKNGKYQTFREPFILNRCVVTVDPEAEGAFELSDLSKDPYIFKGDDVKELKSFLQTVKQQTLNLGIWRRRRNALPNIMIKHMV